MREFETGATRSPLEDKLRYEGFLSPIVLKRYAEYMHKHRLQADGKVREPDNWQKGMTLESYVDSGWRHFMDWWLHHRGWSGETTEDMEESICALLFNSMGYLHELLRKKDGIEAKGIVSNRKSEESSNTRYRIGFEATD